MAAGETIVCGVDDSDGARAALRAANALARRLDARLVVAHAAPGATVPGASAIPGGVERIAAEEEDDARRQVGEMLSAAGLEDAEVRVARGGPPGEALVRIAEDEGAGLLVVGARGRGKIASAVLGSVSTDVVAGAPCPVLVVTGDKRKLGLLRD